MNGDYVSPIRNVKSLGASQVFESCDPLKDIHNMQKAVFVRFISQGGNKDPPIC
jgi:hypothetical protein